MKRFVCIHAHFYQPPRENPWLEAVEIQDSAQPYHDWNAKITAECYAPNAASHILDNEKRIIDISNNYSKISFNVGPTLLMWLEIHAPETYAAILEADRKSLGLFGGHGSAIAQVYNHMIMPLANSHDKRTQIIWGIHDFKHRFQREPEGMWLAETAVDMETLDILAGQGIRFTILAPTQAERIRKIGQEEWSDVSGGKVDPRRPYLCRLSSGRGIAIFFYDGPLSQEIAFGNLLVSGEGFAQRLLSLFSEEEKEDELVHIATDGETYGHHHRFGDMGLAYCLHHLESNKLAQVTNYAAYLEKHPPAYEAEIIENSSWSCFHGIERWRNNCGCNSGTHKEWTQEWRAPLRGAMDWLRDNLMRIYEDQMSRLVKDPWKVRDEYISVILNRRKENVEEFLTRHAQVILSAELKSKALQLLEMQKYAMLMYTSCGWFFDEVSGIESVQVLQYAARAMQLAQQISGIALEEAYVGLLERAPGNTPELKTGATVYQRLVQPVVLDLLRVGVHYAVSSIFVDYAKETDLYVFSIQNNAYERFEAGKHRLAVGHISLRSQVTWEEEEVSFAVLHLGDHNVVGGARSYRGQDLFSQMRQETKDYFSKGEVSEVIRLIDNAFSQHSFSLWHLFRDEQRKIINQIFASARGEIEDYFRKIYEHQYTMIQAAESFGIPVPSYFSSVVAFTLNTDLRRLMEAEEFNIADLKKLTAEAKRWSSDLNRETLSVLASQKISSAMERLARKGDDLGLMANIFEFIGALSDLGLELNLWEAQNIYFIMGKESAKYASHRGHKPQDTQEWRKHFSKLGEFLQVQVKVNSDASTSSHI